MDWKDEEVAAAHDDLPNHDDTYAERCKSVRAIMTRAVELAAARGGTMTAEEFPEGFDDVLREMETRGSKREAQCAVTVRGLMAKSAVLGARNAALEAQLQTAQHEVAQMDAVLRVTVPDIEACMSSTCVWCGTPAPTPVTTETLRAHVSAHVKVCQEHPMRLVEERLSAAEESSRELVRRAQQAEGEARYWQKEHAVMVIQAKDAREEARSLRDRCATLSAAGQVLSAHVDRERHAPMFGPIANVAEAVRRRRLARIESEVSSQPQRYPCSPTCTHDDASTPGHPERVKERSEAFKKTAREPDLSLSVTEAACYEQGAEAMRAACWEAVQRELEKAGLTGHRRAFKAAIEGAVP